MPHKRKRNLTKKLSEVEEIAANNPSTEDFYGEGLVTHFYPSRTQDYKEYCLYDFVAKLTCKGKDKNCKQIYRPLQKNAFQTLLILINEDELVHDGETVQEAFDRQIFHHERCVKANEKFRKLLKCREKLKDIQDARAANREEENDAEDDPQLMGQIKDAMNDMRDMDNGSGLTLQERELMLNKDQKGIIDHVKFHLLRQIEYKNKSKQEKEQSEYVKPLHMFISGVGGTGKSFLIEVIKAIVKSLWSTLTTQTCAVCAPTGLAAYNVGGLTAHRLFQLPIEHEGLCSSYCSIPKASHKVMKMDLKMVIIDEVSMVSSLNLTYIQMRMNDLFKSDEWFGGKNFLFVGDILQLPPVRGEPVFDKVTASTLKCRLGSMGAEIYGVILSPMTN
uniref:ATP-dependent DNA helicase n=1 Tax=Amphimedon queenslandica TaxID=400682 RepID=A0A1X7TV77_AMPQE